MGTKFNLLILFIVSCLSLSAQEGAFNAGVRLGGGYSVNSHVDKILVSEGYYANYSFEVSSCFSFIDSLQAFGALKQALPIITKRREFVTRTRTN